MTCCTLYRHYNAEDELLYVGITFRGEKRMREHAKTQTWWKEVAYTRYDHNFSSLAELEIAETAAIRCEEPRYNKKRYQPRLYKSDQEKRQEWLEAHGVFTPPEVKFKKCGG